MSPPTRKRLPPHERRALIEDAAARLFSARGYAGTRIEDVATAAGVTKPMLYRHFASKKELHLALLARHRDALAVHALAQYVPGDRPLAERLPAMLDAWFEYVEEHPYAWRMLFRDTTGDPDIQAFHRELQGMQRAADVALLLETGLPIPAVQLEPLAEVIRSSLTGLALWWLDHPDVPRAVLVDATLRVCTGLLATYGLSSDG
jgi:AcrR family transcriptional regulator